MHCDELGIWVHMMDAISRFAAQLGAHEGNRRLRIVEARLSKVGEPAVGQRCTLASHMGTHTHLETQQQCRRLRMPHSRVCSWLHTRVRIAHGWTGRWCPTPSYAPAAALTHAH